MTYRRYWLKLALILSSIIIILNILCTLYLVKHAIDQTNQHTYLNSIETLAASTNSVNSTIEERALQEGAETPIRVGGDDLTPLEYFETYQGLLLGIMILNALLFLILFFGLIRLGKPFGQDLLEMVSLSKDLDENRLGEAMALNKSIGEVELSRVSEVNDIRRTLRQLHAKGIVKEKGQKQLLDALVHQSTTPLTILKTHIEGIQDQVIESSPETLQVCAKQVEDLRIMIENMGQMIQSDGHSQKLSLSRIDLPDLVKQVVSGLKPHIVRKGIDLQIDGPERLDVVSDVYKLSQIIYNLLQNACQYTPRGGKVHLEYADIDHVVNICVSDTGLGIQEEEQNHIFEPYFRGTSSMGVDGEGIGLYTVKMNTTLLGGQISLRSKSREGATFIIKLPSERLIQNSD